MKDSAPTIKQYHLHKAHLEKLQFEVYSLNEYRKRNLKKATIPHSHSYYQLIWFLGGGGIHTVDFASYPVEDNTALFISKDQVHSFDDNLDIKGWLIHFNESFFMHSDVDIFLKYRIFNIEQNPCYAVDVETAAIATTYITLIRKELAQRHRFGYEDVIRFLLKSLLINLERVRQKEPERRIEFTNLYEKQFFTFKQLVEEHYTQGLSVNAYANLMNVSSKTLTTITKTIGGQSPLQLVAERIVLEAKRLLKFTTLRVSEIAFRLGFDDPSYFIKYFRRQIGHSPGDYRNII